jgi:hypothetical protein
MTIFLPTPKPSPPAASGSSGSGTSTSTQAGPSGNIEDKLESIELKVYGHSQKELPIFQRLERLERDTNSRVGSGSITDRLQALFKAYGL